MAAANPQRVSQPQQQQLIRPERLWAVKLLNDDYTPFDFVQDLLVSFFHKTPDQAHEITLSVHVRGEGIAGVYPKMKAKFMAAQAMMMARQQGHPLMCVAVPFDGEVPSDLL